MTRFKSLSMTAVLLASSFAFAGTLNQESYGNFDSYKIQNLVTPSGVALSGKCKNGGGEPKAGQISQYNALFSHTFLAGLNSFSRPVSGTNWAYRASDDGCSSSTFNMIETSMSETGELTGRIGVIPKDTPREEAQNKIDPINMVQIHGHCSPRTDLYRISVFGSARNFRCSLDNNAGYINFNDDYLDGLVKRK